MWGGGNHVTLECTGFAIQKMMRLEKQCGLPCPLTNDDDNHAEDLYPRAQAGCEQGGVGWGTEHIPVHQLPACLFKSVILAREEGGTCGNQSRGMEAGATPTISSSLL